MQGRDTTSNYNGSSPSVYQPGTGCKGNSLTINVQSAKEWSTPHTLKECTNSSALTPSGFRSATAYTPDTSYTFGVPNPTNYHPRPLSSSALPTPYYAALRAQQEIHRQRRYSEAEQRLALLAENITETPPTELQIRALKQAAAFINQQAEDARERSVKLRSMLADRAVEPTEYENAQRERWMEEKRQMRMDEELKVFTVTMGHLEGGVKLPSHNEVQEVMKAKPMISAKSRSTQNLAQFLEFTSSRTRTRRPPRRSSLEVNWTPRRMTMNDVTPMRLRPWSVTSAFAESVKAHVRSNSHNVSPISENEHSPFSAPEEVGAQNPQRRSGPTRKILIRTSLTSVAEDVADNSVHSDSAPEFLEGPSTTNTPASSTPSTPFAVDTPLGSQSMEDSKPLTPRPDKMFINDDNTNGTATIYYPSGLSDDRRAEIFADETAVELPYYAHDLLDDLEGKNSLNLTLHPSQVRGSLSSDWSVVADAPRSSTPSTKLTPARSHDSLSTSPRKRSQLSNSPNHPRPSSQIGLLKPKPYLTLGTSTRSSPRKNVHSVHSLLSITEADLPGLGGSGSSTNLSVMGVVDEHAHVDGEPEDDQRLSRGASFAVSLSGSVADGASASEVSLPKMLKRKLSKRLFGLKGSRGAVQ